MKKISKLLLMLGMASLVTFTACKKDDDSTDSTSKDVSATVTLSPTGNLKVGDILTITIESKGNDDNKLKTLTVTRTGKSTPLVDKKLTGTTATDVVRDTMTAEGEFTYTITVGGTNDPKSVVTKSVTVTNGTTEPTYTYQGIIVNLGNQANASFRPFWSADHDANTYTLANVKGQPALQAQMTFGYATRAVASGGNKLISPASTDATQIYAEQWSANDEDITNWGAANRKATLFIKVTNVSENEFNIAFESANETDKRALVEKAKSAGEPTLASISVADGLFFLFKTFDGQYGVISTSGVTGDVVGGSATEGSVVASIIYQKKD